MPANEICYQFAFNQLDLPHITHGTGISIISTLCSKLAIFFSLQEESLFYQLIKLYQQGKYLS